uniref:Uncharacterized protein n=1 Tax=viral metagenome TaxID=1070528 RepID=A0A6M3IHC9_9ZZZZ
MPKSLVFYEGDGKWHYGPIYHEVIGLDVIVDSEFPIELDNGSLLHGFIIGGENRLICSYEFNSRLIYIEDVEGFSVLFERYMIGLMGDTHIFGGGIDDKS